MKIEENFNLKNHSFMKIGGIGRFLLTVENEKDLIEAVNFSREKSLPIYVLGDGSNTIFADGMHEKIFLKITNFDLLKTYEDSEGANVLAGAGVNWDDFVSWTVQHNLAGVEALSAIPGTVGACPIQNIGAYGQEVQNTITNVRAFDLQTNDFFDIPNFKCEFEYRNSLFKKNPGRFIIFSVNFRLNKQEPEIPKYKDVQLYFLGKQQKTASLSEIRNAVIEIRKNKIPDPSLAPNCGSFFKNPILKDEQAEKIIKQFPEIPYFRNSDSTIKFYAGWLIENVGLKGNDFGKIKIDENNALILINHNEAQFGDLILTIEKIHYEIKEMFDIELEPEPNLVS